MRGAYTVRGEARATRAGYEGAVMLPTGEGDVVIHVSVPAAVVRRARAAVRAAIISEHNALHAGRVEGAAPWDIIGDGAQGLDIAALLRQGAPLLGSGQQQGAGSSPLGGLASLLVAQDQRERTPQQQQQDAVAMLGALLRGGAGDSTQASPLGASSLGGLASLLGMGGGGASSLGALGNVLSALRGTSTGPQGGAGAAGALGALRSLLAGGAGGQNAQGAMAGMAPLLAAAAQGVAAGAGEDSAERGLATGLGMMATLAAGAAAGGPVGLIAAIPALIAMGLASQDPANLVLANRQRTTMHADVMRILPPAAGPSVEERDRYIAARYPHGSQMAQHEADDWDAYMDAHGWPHGWPRAVDVPPSIRAAWTAARERGVPILAMLGAVSGADIIGATAAPWRGTAALWDTYVTGPHDCCCDDAAVARRIGASELAARVAEDAPSEVTRGAAGILDAVAGCWAGDEDAASYLARAVEDLDGRADAWRLAGMIDGCA